jgi:hypothetical protein
MGQSVSQVRFDIRQTKEHISETVDELERRVDELKNWQQLVRRYPVPSLMISVGIGLLVAGRLPLFKLSAPVMRYAKGYRGYVVTGAISNAILQGTQQRTLHKTNGNSAQYKKGVF